MRRPYAFACVAALISACACRTANPSVYLDIATTTSVKNSGLLDDLLPAFTSETGVIVRAHATGSGLALGMFEDGVVDLVLTHAPRHEAEYLARHHEWIYRKFAYNRFLVVGPRHDPANIRGAQNAADAFRRIAQADVNFISRNDASGTHERETELWAKAGTRPASDRLIITAGSMAIALRHTDERVGYTLSDEATFRQMRPQLDLDVLFSDGESLLNTYAVIYQQHLPVAQRFAAWLTDGHGRSRLARYAVDRSAMFVPWPDGCPADRPDVLPCGGRGR